MKVASDPLPPIAFVFLPLCDDIHDLMLNTYPFPTSIGSIGSIDAMATKSAHSIQTQPPHATNAFTIYFPLFEAIIPISQFSNFLDLNFRTQFCTKRGGGLCRSNPPLEGLGGGGGQGCLFPHYTVNRERGRGTPTAVPSPPLVPIKPCHSHCVPPRFLSFVSTPYVQAPTGNGLGRIHAVNWVLAQGGVCRGDLKYPERRSVPISMSMSISI